MNESSSDNFTEVEVFGAEKNDTVETSDTNKSDSTNVNSSGGSSYNNQEVPQNVSNGSKTSEDVTISYDTQFLIESDDSGFYMNGSAIDRITSISGGNVSITFQVRESGVYFGGMDFRGCGITSGGTKPGKNVTVEFMLNSNCTITSYWPSSNEIKSHLSVNAV